MHGKYREQSPHIHIFWAPWKTSDFVVVKSPVLTTSHSLPQWPESTQRELHRRTLIDRSSLSSCKDCCAWRSKRFFRQNVYHDYPVFCYIHRTFIKTYILIVVFTLNNVISTTLLCSVTTLMCTMFTK